MHVNWNAPIRHTRMKSGKPYSERRYWATCACGSQKLLKACDARKSEKNGAVCLACSQREKAALGYAACSRKYGDNFAANIARQYRLDHPSSLELQVMAHLEALNLPYIREAILCDRWMVDFLIDGRLVIEVDGDYAHSRRDPITQAKRREQIEQAGYPILNIREADVPFAAALITVFVLEDSNVGYVYSN